MNRSIYGGIPVTFRRAVVTGAVLVALSAASAVAGAPPGTYPGESGFLVKVRDAAKPGRSDPRPNMRNFPPRGHIGSIPSTIDGARFHSPSDMPDRIEEVTQPPVGIPAPRPECTVAAVATRPFVPLRNPDKRVSMRDEMVAVHDFDYGRFRAMIVKNDTDPFRICGFVRIPAVWGIRFAPPEGIRRAPVMLAEALNRYTGIEARPDGHLRLTDRRLFSTPFLYITTAAAFELTREEMKCFGDYLRSGGFAFLDEGDPTGEKGPAGVSLKRMVRDALGSQARIEPIPTGHPLYRCLFDFTDGPPIGDENMLLINWQRTDAGISTFPARSMAPVFYLEGVFLEGRLVAVHSEKCYGMRWAQSNPGNNTPQMKFAVNLLVYALTRGGGMTGGIMDGFSDTH